MPSTTGFTVGQRRLATLAPVVMLVLAVLASGYAFLRLYQTRRWVTHTHVVIETAQRVNVHLTGAESAQRGYLLTGELAYLRRYAGAQGDLTRDTAELRRLTRDNVSQQRRLDTLGVYLAERIRLLDRGIHLRVTRSDSAASLPRLEQGRKVMEAVAGTMFRLEQEEQRLLEERVAAEQRRLQWLVLVLALGFLAVGGVAYLVNRALARYAESEREALQRIEEQNEELQQQSVEMELQAENLEQQAAELEILNEQLNERTVAAEAERQHTAEILESISDAFYALDGDWRFLYVNARAEGVLARRREELIGQEIWETLPELRAAFEGPFRQAASSSRIGRFEHYDAPRNAFYSVVLYPSEGGLSVYLHDVTDSRATELEFRALSETIPQLVWSTTPTGGVDYRNERWHEYTGIARDAIGSGSAFEIIHPDDAAAVQSEWARSLRTGEPFEKEYRFRRHDGRYRWFIARGVPVRAPDGRILRWFGTSTDIHEEREAAQAVRRLSSELKARVAELEAIFERLPVGISIAEDPECLNIHVNPAFARLLRVSEGENISSGRPDAERALPYTVWQNGAPMAVEDMPLQVAARTARPVEGIECELRFNDGTAIQLYGWAAPLFDDDGGVRGAIGGFVDLTARMQAAAEIRRLAERTSKLYALSAALSRASTPHDVAAVGCEWGRAVLGGSVAVFMTLRPDASSLEMLHADGFTPSFMDRWRSIPLSVRTPLTEAIRTGGPVHAGSAAERDASFPGVGWPDGVEAMLAAPLVIQERSLGAWVVHFDAPREFADDDVNLFHAVTVQLAQALDRARLFEAETQARRAAEAANQAKLKFLRVMSHDLRTPLNAILGYTELLHDSVPGPLNDTQRTFLTRVRASTTMLRALIDDILEFARIEAGRVEIRAADIDVARLLESVEAVVGAQVRAKGIRFARKGIDGRLAVRADAERARQVLMNLVSNALKFTASGGEITLEAEADENRVRVLVRDNGMGIPPDQIENIFEPFVQAHRPEELGTEQGVGLGLAISRELARAMGGDVTAVGQVGIGSVFTLELPRADAPEGNTSARLTAAGA